MDGTELAHNQHMHTHSSKVSETEVTAVLMSVAVNNAIPNIGTQSVLTLKDANASFIRGTVSMQ